MTINPILSHKFFMYSLLYGFPFSRAKIRSAFCTVFRRCAIIITAPFCEKCCNLTRKRHPPGNSLSFGSKRKLGKENCRCFDAVRGCARGATVERSETGERTMIAPAGQSTARAGLRSKLAALVVRRQAGPAT